MGDVKRPNTLPTTYSLTDLSAVGKVVLRRDPILESSFSFQLCNTSGGLWV